MQGEILPQERGILLLPRGKDHTARGWEWKRGGTLFPLRAPQQEEPPEGTPHPEEGLQAFLSLLKLSRHTV